MTVLASRKQPIVIIDDELVRCREVCIKRGQDDPLPWADVDLVTRDGDVCSFICEQFDQSVRPRSDRAIWRLHTFSRLTA